MKNLTLLLSLCLTALAAFPSSLSATQLVEMRLILDKPSDDAEQMPLGKSKLFVQKTVLLDQSDLRSVAVSTNTPMSHPQTGLVFQFTKSGWKHFSEVARQYRGKHLAIVIDGRVYATPVIQPKSIFDFHADNFEFHGPFTEQEAAQVAVKIDKALRG